MAQINQDKCEGCGMCVSLCPNNAIRPAGISFKIDADECVDCGFCADNCTAQAIAMD